MNTNYALSQIKNNDEVLKQVSKFEEELSKQIGHDVVLIVYDKK
jgi:hypothetical protein